MGLSYSESRQIADRYATASFALSADKKEESATAVCLGALAGAIKESADLKRLIENPVIDAKEKKAAFAAILKKMKAPASASDLVDTVLDNHRGELLPAIAELFQQKLDAAENRVRVHVKSAKPLNDKTIKEIEKALSSGKQTIALTAETDETLIGGLTLTYGSRQLDASIKGRLNRLATKLKQAEAA